MEINLNMPINAKSLAKVDDIIRASGDHPVVYIDIDGTIVTEEGTPNEHVISLMNYLHKKNAEIYLWSVGGKQNCKTVAERYNIEHLVVAYLPKPMISIDDMQYDDYVFLKLHPADLE